MRPLSTTLVAVAVLAGASATGWGLLRANDETSPAMPWDTYRLTDQGVEVYRLLRSCDRVTGIDVEETGARVEIRLHVDRDAGCGDVAIPTANEVRLDEDLGTRVVYDAACIERGFPSSLCERSVRLPATPR